MLACAYGARLHGCMLAKPEKSTACLFLRRTQGHALGNTHCPQIGVGWTCLEPSAILQNPARCKTLWTSAALPARPQRGSHSRRSASKREGARSDSGVILACLEPLRLVQDALAALQAGRTTLVIAHRLSTIREASSIAVVQVRWGPCRGWPDLQTALLETAVLWEGIVRALCVSSAASQAAGSTILMLLYWRL